jgi:hypothetical protein
MRKRDGEEGSEHRRKQRIPDVAAWLEELDRFNDKQFMEDRHQPATPRLGVPAQHGKRSQNKGQSRKSD